MFGLEKFDLSKGWAGQFGGDLIQLAVLNPLDNAMNSLVSGSKNILGAIGSIAGGDNRQAGFAVSGSALEPASPIQSSLPYQPDNKISLLSPEQAIAKSSEAVINAMGTAIGTLQGLVDQVGLPAKILLSTMQDWHETQLCADCPHGLSAAVAQTRGAGAGMSA